MEIKKDRWEDGKCFLTKLGWSDDKWDPKYDTIKADVMKLEVAESLMGTVEECKGKADGDKVGDMAYKGGFVIAFKSKG